MKFRLKTISVLTTAAAALPLLTQAQTPAPAPVPTVLPVKAPSVQNPTVNVPKPPAVTAPTGGSATAPTAAASTGNSAPSAPSTAKTRAALVTTAYSDSTYHTAIASGSPVILIFADSTDMVWAKQAPLLQSILREAEFRKYPSLQVDMIDKAATEKFSVAQATTILIMKDGDERIRSARMINPDVIRKMIRLANAL